MAEFDIFVSYRRVGAIEFVEELYNRLQTRGYRVFLDLEELREGEYEKTLLNHIENCTDFILPLPPGALDRCFNPEDVVRKEIATALAMGKNIIPIYFHGFSMPDELPEDIEALRKHNAIVTYGLSYDDIVRKILREVHAERVDAETPPIMRLFNWLVSNEHIYLWRIIFFPILAIILLGLFLLLFADSFGNTARINASICGLFFSLVSSTLVGFLFWVVRRLTKRVSLRFCLNLLVWPIAYLIPKAIVDHFIWNQHYELWFSPLGMLILSIPLVVALASFVCTVLVNFFGGLLNSVITEILK